MKVKRSVVFFFVLVLFVVVLLGIVMVVIKVSDIDGFIEKWISIEC